MLIVKKFGGTSLANSERIAKVVDIISKYAKFGHKLVIIVSAPAGLTDKIYSDAKKLSGSLLDNFNEETKAVWRECDQALSSGENINAALLSLALNAKSIPAQSFNAWNLPIYASGDFFNAEIVEIDKKNLMNNIKNNKISVITGFQGVDFQKENCFTLGRGGSDYSAVVIAAALNAYECYIYTDVDGFYEADPNIIKNAKKINHLSYEEAVLAAEAGAKILQDKAALAAKKYNVNLKILSSFYEEIDQNNGTCICHSGLIQRAKDEWHFLIATKIKPKNENFLIVSILFFGRHQKIRSFNLEENFLPKLKDFLQDKGCAFAFYKEDNKFSFEILNDEKTKEFLNELYNFCKQFFKNIEYND